MERLGGLGREIHGELESQSRMLDELDEEVETTHHRQEASSFTLNCHQSQIVGSWRRGMPY